MFLWHIFKLIKAEMKPKYLLGFRLILGLTLLVWSCPFQMLDETQTIVTKDLHDFPHSL
jgi:hypothetical protein